MLFSSIINYTKKSLRPHGLGDFSVRGVFLQPLFRINDTKVEKENTTMKLVTAIVRPEKVMDVIKALEESGYFAFSKWAISGRGKEKGIQVGDVLYQEMAKSMLYITVEDKEKDEVVDIIVNSAKSGAYGHYGDGKIFVSDIEEAYTISEETREDED